MTLVTGSPDIEYRVVMEVRAPSRLSLRTWSLQAFQFEINNSGASYCWGAFAAMISNFSTWGGAANRSAALANNCLAISPFK